MTARGDGMPPRSVARIAGVLYLAIVAGGVFAEMFVREPLTVSGDAAATARGILANESLFRAGFAAHLLYLGCAVPVAVCCMRCSAHRAARWPCWRWASI